MHGADYLCWDGPCKDILVTECPLDAGVGTACAIPWKTVEGKDRYAIYILLQKPSGDLGLVYEKRSYTKPWQAQQRVKQLGRLVAAARASAPTN